MTDEDMREPHLRHSDFCGAFGILRREGRLMMVSNRRVIDGRETTTWDLPGGQVEPRELLMEALVRELREELDIGVPATAVRFAFLQEGERIDGDGRRSYAWRSFFFLVDEFDGVPRATGEVLGAEWVPMAEVRARLTAPYHASFRDWLDAGEPVGLFGGDWRD